MATTIFDSVESSAKNWWLSLLLGLLFIFMGFWVIKTPLESYISLSIIFSALLFVSGIFEIAFAVSNRRKMEGWGWYLAGGILDLLIGILLISHPIMTMTILPFYVGFWVLFQSILGIGLSFQLKYIAVPNWGWLLFLGILTLLFSFLLLMNPVFAGLSIVYMTALSFIAMGIFRVFLAFNLRKIHKYLRD